jgi:hypothetical protein
LTKKEIGEVRFLVGWCLVPVACFSCASLERMIKQVLEQLLPVRGKRASIEQGAPWDDMSDWVMQTKQGLRVVLRLVITDEDGSIRDIKEQIVVMVPAAAGEVPEARLEAHFRGWRAAVQRVLDGAPFSTIEVLMPHDLTAPKVLALKKAKTADDFRDAFLARSRLGRFLPA